MDSAASLLVVDDSEANRDMLSRRLQRNGFAVTTAEGGKAALELIAGRRFDLVLLDLVMPDLHGLEVLRILRETWLPADLPIIIATAMDESGDIVKGLNAGANDYVTKPLDLPVVLARIRTQLSLKRAVDRIRRLEEDLEARNAELVSSNARLEVVNRQIVAANARMQRDLDAAARIQEAQLPTMLPASASATFAWLLKPCAQLAGDTLNIFQLDDDHVGLYVLDVVGHGVAASLLSVAVSRVLSPTRNSFLLRPREGSPGYRYLAPAEVAMQLDRRFPFDPVTEEFFTLLYGVLDLRTRELRYVSAGHPAPILLSRGADAPRVLASASGMPIGLGEASYEEQSEQLQPGDRLFLYSDGVPEALNAQGQRFQMSRLLEVLARTRTAPLAQSLDAVWTAIADWGSGSELADDASLVAVEILA